jgi:MYXO-CTERM domain-containing protein
MAAPVASVCPRARLVFFCAPKEPFMTGSRLPLVGPSMLFLGLFLGCWLGAGCTPPDGDADPDPQIEGEIEVRIIDHFDGTSGRAYRLARAGTRRSLRLQFEQDPDLLPGTRVQVWGRRADDEFAVQGWKALALPDDHAGLRGDLDVQSQPLLGAPAFPKRKLAFVLVDLGGGINITAEQARAKAFGTGATDQSMKQVVLEYSFGRQDLEGEVVGPIKAQMNGCDEDALADSIRAMVPPGFDNVVWYFGQKVAACDWAGIAPLGRAGKPANELWVNGTASCRVATHEFGHNLGLQHAARLRCTGAALLDDPSKCQSSEYGDSTDVMGDGCNHFNGYSKAYLTYFEKCNGVQAGASGTFTLLPVETACNGTQVLLVPMPKMRKVGGTDLKNYVLELRAPIGLDAKLGPVVMVRLAAPLSQMRGGAKMTWIIDTNPATTALDGLHLGESFTDPAGGVSFKVEAISAAGASIKVDIAATGGATTCLDGTPFSAPGLASCGNESGSEGPTVPTPDAGTGSPAPGDAGAETGGSGGAEPGNSGGTTSSGGRSGSGGRGGNGGSPKVDGGAPSPAPANVGQPSGGCSCRMSGVSGAEGPGALPTWLVGLLAVALRRRRHG